MSRSALTLPSIGCSTSTTGDDDNHDGDDRDDDDDRDNDHNDGCFDGYDEVVFGKIRY